MKYWSRGKALLGVHGKELAWVAFVCFFALLWNFTWIAMGIEDGDGAFHSFSSLVCYMNTYTCLLTCVPFCLCSI